MRLLGVIQDFSFDTTVQKFAFTLSPQTYDEYSGPLSAGNSVFTSIKIRLSNYDALTRKQARYFASIFGGEYTDEGWYSDFVVANTENKPYYSSPLYHLYLKAKNKDSQYYRGMLSDMTSVQAYC